MAGFNKYIKAKIYNYYKSVLNLRRAPRGYIRGKCPYCGHKNAFRVNVLANRAECYSCGVPRSPVKTLLDVLSLGTYNELWSYLDSYMGDDVAEFIFDSDSSIKEEKKEFKQIQLPEDFKLISIGNSEIAKVAQNYIRNKRKLKISSLAMAGVGYCSKGPYAGYIVFPYFSKGRLVYFQSRKFLDNAGPKFNNPNSADYGIGKDQIVYNVDALYLYDKVYLVESVINALTLGSNALALSGKSMTPYQLSLILKSPVSKVVIGLDFNAELDAISIALKLVNHKQIKILFFSDSRDINDLGKAKAKAIERESPWLTYGQLISLRSEFMSQNHG